MNASERSLATALAVALVTLLASATAHASKPTQFASLRSVCNVKEGCVVVLIESEETPPALPPVRAAISRQPPEPVTPPGNPVVVPPARAAISRQPLPLPADPGGEYRFVNSCSPVHGYFVAVTRKSSPAVRVKVLRAFNDPALKPFSLALPDGPRLGPGCDHCIFPGCQGDVKCGPGETCTLSLPPKGARFIAQLQKSGTKWSTVRWSRTNVVVVGDIGQDRSPLYGSRLSTFEPATPELVAELERYFARGRQ